MGRQPSKNKFSAKKKEFGENYQEIIPQIKGTVEKYSKVSNASLHRAFMYSRQTQVSP